MLYIYKIYRAKDMDLGLHSSNTKKHLKNASHDVIVSSYNKRSKNCYVRTITSLECKRADGRYTFNNRKLDAVRNGEIIVIPQTELKTRVLSGVYKKPIKIKFNKLYPSNTGSTEPKKYKNIIKKM